MVIPSLGKNANCIISDDGSNDDTLILLEKAKAAYPWLSVVSSATNQGKSNALSNAISKAHGDYILILDGDLQNDPSDFLPMFNAAIKDQADCMVGWRKNRKDHPSKLFVSKIYNGLLNIIFDMQLHDHNCGLKLFRRVSLLKLVLRGEWHRYITVLFYYAGFRVSEIEVTHHARIHGKSRYGLNRYIRFFSDLPPLMYQIRQQKRFGKGS